MANGKNPKNSRFSRAWLTHMEFVHLAHIVKLSKYVHRFFFCESSGKRKCCIHASRLLQIFLFLFACVCVTKKLFLKFCITQSDDSLINHIYERKPLFHLIWLLVRILCHLFRLVIIRIQSTSHCYSFGMGLKLNKLHVMGFMHI